ncbi:MAG: adenylyltransferase/cytidyltransferase family protein [Dehalococcoidia bacterium]
MYVDMVADLFHYGHVNFLRQAKLHGDFLLVGVHSDETVTNYKRNPILSMEERVLSVAGCRYVDEVVPNAPLEITLDWIEKHNIDLIIHGDDVAPEIRDAWYGVPIKMGIYKSVGYTSGISTTELISRIRGADIA